MPLVQTRGAASAQGFGEFAQTGAVNYIEDVFSCFLYTGNGATQTITNNIDLSTKGGLTWIKGRSGATDNALYDTARGATFDLASNLTTAQTTQATGLTAFGTTGFSIGALAKLNTNAATYVSWTFRKQPKFFDVVTYTGNGVAGRSIAHNLGSLPGSIIVKATSVSGQDWFFYHRSLSTNGYLLLNSTGAEGVYPYVYNPTTTTFDVASSVGTNGNGTTYVAYLFAHDAGGFGLSGTDNVISCGSFNNAVASEVTLGWEPQWLLVKSSSADSNWHIIDTMRGMSNTGQSLLTPNNANAEIAQPQYFIPTATGFTQNPFFGNTIIYIAIRRGPMRVPSDATRVFKPISQTYSNGSLINTGFTTDLFHVMDTAGGNQTFIPRLTVGALNSSDTNAESASSSYVNYGSNVGVTLTNAYGGTPPISFHGFQRAPSFFDVVCYTGTGVARTVAHNLAAVPELLIVKSRTQVINWIVWSKSGTQRNDFCAFLNGAASYGSTGGDLVWGTPGSGTPSMTSTTFSLGDYIGVNNSGSTYVAYLFATCAGVSKVGSYTGNGSSQTINCGFTGGARFVMVKRTDAGGNWLVVDTARGLVSAGDPTLYLNSTAAEVTGADWIDPDSSGFIVNQEGTMNANVNAATYIFLSIA